MRFAVAGVGALVRARLSPRLGVWLGAVAAAGALVVLSGTGAGAATQPVASCPAAFTSEPAPALPNTGEGLGPLLAGVVPRMAPAPDRSGGSAGTSLVLASRPPTRGGSAAGPVPGGRAPAAWAAASDDRAWTGETTAGGTRPPVVHGLDTVLALSHRALRPIGGRGTVRAGRGHRDLATLPVLPVVGILESSSPIPNRRPAGGSSSPTRLGLFARLDPADGTASWIVPDVIGTLLADAGDRLDELVTMAVARALAGVPALGFERTAPLPPHRPAEVPEPAGPGGSIRTSSGDRSAVPRWPKMVAGLGGEGPSPAAPGRARPALELRSPVSPAGPRRAEADQGSASDLGSGSSAWAALLASPPAGVPHPWRWPGRLRAMWTPVRASPAEPPG